MYLHILTPSGFIVLFCGRGSTAVTEEMRIAAQIAICQVERHPWWSVNGSQSSDAAPLQACRRCDRATLRTAISRLCAQMCASRAQSFELRGGPAWPGCAQWMLQFSAKEGHGKVPNCRVGGGVQLGQAPCPPDALQIANYIFQGPPPPQNPDREWCGTVDWGMGCDSWCFF